MSHRSLSIQIEDSVLQEKVQSGACFKAPALRCSDDRSSTITLEGRLNEQGVPLRLPHANISPDSTFTFAVTMYIREDLGGEVYYRYLGDMHSPEFRLLPPGNYKASPLTIPTPSMHASAATTGYTSNILRACSESAPITTPARQAPTNHHVSGNRLTGRVNQAVADAAPPSPNKPKIPAIALKSGQHRVLDHEMLNVFSHHTVATTQRRTVENTLLQPMLRDERTQREYLQSLSASRASPLVLEDFHFLPVSDMSSNIDACFMNGSNGGGKAKTKTTRNKKPPLGTSTPRNTNTSYAKTTSALKPSRSCGDLTLMETPSVCTDWVRHSVSGEYIPDSASSSSGSPRASVESPQFYERAHSLFYSKFGYMLSEGTESSAKYKRMFDSYLTFSRKYCDQKVSGSSNVPHGVAAINPTQSRDSTDDDFIYDVPPPAKRHNSSRDPSPTTVNNDLGTATDNMMFDFDDLALFRDAILSPPALTPRSAGDMLDRISPSLYALVGDPDDLSNDIALFEQENANHE